MPATPGVDRLVAPASVAGLLVLLVLATVAQPVAGQLEETRGIQYIDMTLEEGVLEPEPPGEARTRLQVSVRSSVASDAESQAYRQSSVQFRGRILPAQGNTTSGWGVGFVPQSVSMEVGETRNVTVIVAATMGAQPSTVRVEINATALIKRRYDSYVTHSEVTAIGRLQPRRLAGLFLIEPPPTVGPRGVTTTNIRLSNSGFYPDQYSLTVEDSGALTVATPGTVGLEPRSTRDIPVTIFGPQTTFEYGQMELVRMTATSMNDPSVSFTKTFVVNVSGFYLPPWTFPFWIVLVALVAYGGQRTYEKVKEDRRRYGHPGPKFTDEQEEKLAQLKERDEAKYETVKTRLEEQHKEQLQAYKERKKEGKAKETGAVLAKLDDKRKEQEKARKRGIKKVKKGKKKGRPPKEILQDLEPEERDQLGDALPEMLQAATATGAVAAIQDDEAFLADRRRDKARAEERRLRAEALALIQHRQQEGVDPDAIRDELTVPHEQALGDDLDAALTGRIDEAPREIIAGLPLLERRKGRKFLKKLEKEREKLRKKAVKVIKKGKKKDWSKREVLERLDPEQIFLVGDLLPKMLDAHLTEEVELILLDAADDLTSKEQRRRRKLQKKLNEHRREEMQSGAEKIEALEAEGAGRERVLAELTRAERWAIGDLLDILVQSLPEAARDLAAYLEQTDDLDEGERELLEDHLEHLREAKIKHAAKGLKRVDKGTRKDKDAREILDGLSILERACLEDVLAALLKPALSERIAGLEAFVEETPLSEEEVEMWEGHVATLRDRRDELREEAIETIQDLKADATPPDAILDALGPAEVDAVGAPLDRMVEATLPEDVAVLAVLAADETDRDDLEDAREEAAGARREALSDVLEKVARLRDGEGGLLSSAEPKPPEAIVDALDWTERQLLGETLPILLDRDPVARLERLTSHLEDADLRPGEEDAWEAHLDVLRDRRDEVRRRAVDTIQDLKSDGEPPEAILDALDVEEQAVLGDALERMLEATLPEEVEVLHQVTRPERDAEELEDAREDAKKRRRKVLDGAVKKIKKLKKKDAEPDAILEALDAVEQAVLGDDLDAMVEAAVPEAVEVLAVRRRDDADRDAVQEALEAARDARRDARADALKTLHKAQDKGRELQEAVRELPYGQRRILDEDPPEVDDAGRLVEEPPDTGGLFSFGGSGASSEQEGETDEDADETPSGGGLADKLPFGSRTAKAKEWKKAFAKRLLKEGVPAARVKALVARAESKDVGDLPAAKRQRILDALERKALEEET